MSTALSTLTSNLRFMSKVRFDGDCWIWTASKNYDGYGTFRTGNSIVKAHRFAFEQANATKIEHKKLILHKCDTPSCVNPNHLFMGTQSDNMQDMATKNRGVFPNQIGSAHSRAKLNDSDVVQILSEKSSHINLAKKYGVSRSTISMIKSGKNWKHIEKRGNV